MSTADLGLRSVQPLAIDLTLLRRNRVLKAATYYGGKVKLAGRYIPRFPRHAVYVEPFGGSGTILLNKPRSRVEVYNDLEEGVYSFFRCLRDEQLSAELFQQLKLTPYSRDEHDFCVNEYAEKTSLVEKARRWFVATQSSYSSLLESSFSVSKSKSRAQEWRRRLDRVEPIIERFTRRSGGESKLRQCASQV